ncbi:hypothetical protein Ancab_038694, partial [Ancistrocladus abbreviatus]
REQRGNDDEDEDEDEDEEEEGEGEPIGERKVVGRFNAGIGELGRDGLGILIGETKWEGWEEAKGCKKGKVDKRQDWMNQTGEG